MPWHNFCFGQELVLLFLSLVGSVVSLDTKEFQKGLHAKVIWAVAGRDVELPCDITPALPGDNVTMIFWFKGSMIMPLYTLDARNTPLEHASHLAMSDDLGTRSIFIIEGHPSKARLKIQGVKMEDEGVFRCRVDFVNSPTRNFQINLTLVVQPSAPKIFDAEGRELRISQVAGPFLEGKELFLSCQVRGGNPKPSLTWWFNNSILDAVIDSSRASTTTVNQLDIKNTPRNFKGGRLECRATSSEEAGYISRKVPLTVFLKPDKVKIVSPNDLLSIRKSQNIRCETSGSYPPAKLTWLLDGKAIRNAVVTEEETETFTGSILSLNVKAEDDGKDLVCRADNPRFPGGSAEDRRQIHVAYPPRISVKAEVPTFKSSIKEGTNVVLRCDSSARPPAHSYSWYLDSHLIPYNETAGIMPSDEKLYLKNVKQESGGQYACSAMNSEGETYSAPFSLKVQYPPRCKKGLESVRVGAPSFETSIVQCQVDALPQVTRFSWTYNTTKGVFAISGDKIENHENLSVLHFTPETEEIQSLACWATNSVGQQEVPCLFHIVPSEAPESPRSCTVRNASHGSGLEVSCVAGSDGGLHQSFVLEVYDVTAPSLPPGVTTLNDQGEQTSPRYRVLGEHPIFSLHNLETGREYQVSVYAENARGKSQPPVVLRVEPTGVNLNIQEEDPMLTHSPANTQLQPTNRNLTLIIVSVAAVAVFLIISIIVISTVIACRKPEAVRRRQRRSKPPEECELSEDGFGEGFFRRSAQYRASMYGECEERISRMIEGPDLIMAPVSISQDDLDF